MEFRSPPRQHPEFAEREPVDLVVLLRRRRVHAVGRPRPPTPGGALLEVATQLCLDAPKESKGFE